MKITTIRGNEMDVLTRREVIEIWSRQNDELLDSPVCPNCHDLLVKKSDGAWFCENGNCLF